MNKTCSRCGQTKHEHCFGHRKSSKDGLAGRCKECVRGYYKRYDEARGDDRVEYRKKRYAENKESIKKLARDRYTENIERERIRTKNYRDNNKPAIAEANRIWREKNAEALMAKKAAWAAANADMVKTRMAEWAKANPDRVRAAAAKRRAAVLQATPRWADLGAIDAIYASAVEVELATGVSQHVDHILPLRGRIVCGLHVEHNLRVIPAIDNLSKGNRVMGL